MKMLSKAGLQHLTKHLNPSSQVLLRTDFNVPIKDGKITDDKRIQQTIPTIEEILKYNPKSLVILSHMGRPRGQKIPSLSLKPVLPQLQSYLKRKVTFLDDCVSDSTLSRVKQSKNQIFLCENVRYHAEETGELKNKDGTKTKIQPKKIKQFRERLSQLGNCFVNDGFGTVHRAHSSVIGINHKYRVAGFLMQKQLNHLSQFFGRPKRPVLAILGGSKVQDKILIVKHMLEFADEAIIGGAMANPFISHIFKHDVGGSLNAMPENPNELNEIIDLSKKLGKTLHFPVDYRIAPKQQMNDPKDIKIVSSSESIPSTHAIFDIGPESAKNYDKIISRANSIFWNGPVGVFQVQAFRKGSEAILNSMIKATKQRGAFTLIGGGDSASLVDMLGKEKQVSFVSTGGGATLQLFEGKELPGVRALSNVEQLILNKIIYKSLTKQILNNTL